MYLQKHELLRAYVKEYNCCVTFCTFWQYCFKRKCIRPALQGFYVEEQHYAYQAFEQFGALCARVQPKWH